MARIRKGVSYRRLERPNTRVSKYKKKGFVKMGYNSRIIRFVMGNLQKEDFEIKLRLVTKIPVQLRDNSVESARLTSNRLLEKSIGPNNYFFRVKKYPYHILRENPIASGAGADRFSTGMQKSFGKPIGQAAQFKRGDAIFELMVDKKHLDVAKKAMGRAAQKIAPSCYILVSDNS